MPENNESTVTFELDAGDPSRQPQLTQDQAARLDAMSDNDIDYSDISDTGDDADFWATARIHSPQNKHSVFIPVL